MRKVVLIFPDVISIAEFVLSYKVAKIIIDSSEKKLTGIISDKHLDIAVKQYGARIKESLIVNSF
jgi:hypothetical protein